LSRGRFGLLLGLLFAVLGGAAFLAVTLVLESDEDEPATATTTTVPLTTTTTIELATPTFVAVVRSQADEAGARATADQLTEAGFTSGVLHSDDYSSLNPGFWVAYVGPYPDIGAADTAVGELTAAGYPGGYPRCIGTDAECE
jgi:mannose/fructose/N-acetylgalactosamine-specific phosphotransferase system component IIC